MEVGVVLAGQRMKTLKYQTISTINFFIRTEISLLNYHGKPGRQRRKISCFCTTEHVTTINTTPKKHHCIYKEGSSLLHNYHGKASVQPLN